MKRIIEEVEFSSRLSDLLSDIHEEIGWTTGPGRSGAIAAVYASHILGIPFVPFGSVPPLDLGRALIIDTACQSGRTLRKASKKYEKHFPLVLYAYKEPPRITFWYEHFIRIKDQK